ncbi:MAG TPA: HEAT repeat domain-containing protein [Planctomycetota bacterium]|nr:HEAT repeat domain-containing protein [Planctomycetota bacterium]
MRRTLLATVALLALLLRAALAGDDALGEARKALEAALAAQDAARLRSAIAAVAAEPGERAMKLLAGATAASRDLDVYGDLLRAVTATALASEPALREAARTATKEADWTVRYLFVEALAEIDRPEARQALFAAFEDRHEGVAAHAMRAAATRKVKAAVRPLVDALERAGKKEKGGKLETEARRALGELTGESLTSAGDWRRWWEANEATFDPAGVAAKKARDEDVGTVVRRVEERGEGVYIERLAKGDIFVVAGRLDKTEQVLDSLKLPYTLWKREEAAGKLATLDPKAVLVYNCECDPSKTLRGPAAAALGSFVERGGYLFTSDWSLTEEVVPATGNCLLPGPVTQQQPFESKIALARGAASHPYMRDVFPENPFDAAKMKWHFDGSCCTIRTTPKSTALVECAELGQKYQTPVVAATFRYGKGSVLHVIGHFREQRDGAGDGFAMQQMLVNFIVEKQKFRKKAK